MRKLIIIAILLFIAAIVAPELRPVLVVGSFCWFAGMLQGSRYGAKHYVNLMDARAERTPVDRHSIGEATRWQTE